MSCFVVLFSVLFRLQLSFVRLNRSQVVRIELPCISVLVRLRTGKVRHRNTRVLYSNNLRVVGPNQAQLKTRTESKATKQDTGVKTR